MIQSSLRWLAILSAAALNVRAQPSTQPATEDKRILWIFTNHRTTDASEEHSKLTPGGKFAIAWADATDRAIFAKLLFSLESVKRATPILPSKTSVAGYAKRFSTTYADFAIENMMTEGVSPRCCIRTLATSRPRRGHQTVKSGLRDEPTFFTRGDSEASNSIIQRFLAPRRP